MSARIYATSTPTQRGMWGAPVLPMDAEQTRFWSIFHARREEQEKKQ